jgi:hypothetical protein
MGEEAVFRLDGQSFVPGELARGPWDPGAQHGGAPAALLARALERLEGTGDMLLARLTVEFVRPVPLAPLRLEAGVTRPGRRVQLAGARLLAGEEEVCRGSALRIRRTSEPVAEGTEPDRPPVGPEHGVDEPFAFPGLERSFVGEAVEKRFVKGDYGGGPATVWMRLRHPLVAGEEPSPAQRVAAIADFGNGVSAAVPWDSHLFINPDLNVHLEREPEGEWICLEAVTRVQPSGTGSAESVLYDARGRIGRAVQALYVDRR